jgi:putative endonuclease
MGTKASHLALGENGEILAERFLAGKGLRIVERRVRYACGEIDLVAKDGDEWVFVEVKTRKSVSSGSAAEAFTPAKTARMRRAVEMYVYDNNLSGAPMRCDFLAIDLEPGGTPVVTHFSGETPWLD